MGQSETSTETNSTQSLTDIRFLILPMLFKFNWYSARLQNTQSRRKKYFLGKLNKISMRNDFFCYHQENCLSQKLIKRILNWRENICVIVYKKKVFHLLIILQTTEKKRERILTCFSNVPVTLSESFFLFQKMNNLCCFINCKSSHKFVFYFWRRK